MDINEEDPIIIILGCTNTGKSSLLNNIAQEAAFKSGIINDGKTTVTKVSKRYNTHGMELVDTPGINLYNTNQTEINTEMTHALKEIRKVFLHYKGKYVKLIFLAKIDSPQTQEKDNLLLKIFDGILDFGNNYSIIFNMVKRKDYENFDYHLLQKPYHTNTTSSFLVRPFSLKAYKKRDYIGPMNSELLGFINSAPYFQIPEHSKIPNNNMLINHEKVNINVKRITGDINSYKVDLKMTIKELKILIEQSESISANKQTIIFKGLKLQDDTSLTTYEIKEDSTIHLIIM